MKKNNIYPDSIKGSNSLLAKHLTPEIFESINNKYTSNNFSFEKLINSGVQNFDSGIGVYAGDKESYETFSPLLNNIITDYHGNCEHVESKMIVNPNKEILDCDPENKFIISTRIRVARNIKGLPFGAHISNEKRNFVETIVSNILKDFQSTLAGKYFSLKKLSTTESEQLITDHFLFKAGDRFLDAAGLNRDWPNGRGIFHNQEKTFLVWINEEDHLRIISMQSGGNITEVFNRLVLACKKLEEKLEFSHSKKLGFLASCPTNIGTAMRASVHIKLPKLGKKTKKFNQITDKYHLQIRGINGEHSESENNIFDISNKRRLGINEHQCIQDLYDGVLALIEAEKNILN